MKVKEYIQQYNTGADESTPREAVGSVVRTFFAEFKKKVESRNLTAYSSRDSWCAVLDEADREWHKIAEEIPIMDPKGFQTIILGKQPELGEIWKPKMNR